jgi:hypothetical protein
MMGGEGTWTRLKMLKKYVGTNHSKMRHKKGKKKGGNRFLAS